MFKNKRGGFLFIEVLVAIFILAVILMTLISVFIYGFNALSKIKQLSLATHIAQQQIETLRNTNFDDILALGSSSFFSNDRLSELNNGQGSLFLENVPGDSSNNITKATVQITWKYQGKEMKKTVVSYIARWGLNRKE